MSRQVEVRSLVSTHRSATPIVTNTKCSLDRLLSIGFNAPQRDADCDATQICSATNEQLTGFNAPQRDADCDLQ